MIETRDEVEFRDPDGRSIRVDSDDVVDVGEVGEQIYFSVGVTSASLQYRRIVSRVIDSGAFGFDSTTRAIAW